MGLTRTAVAVGVVVGVLGMLVTLSLRAADRAAVSERFDSLAASTALAVQNEIDFGLQVLHGIQVLRRAQPSLTEAQLAEYLEEGRDAPGVMGYGTVMAVGDSFIVDLFWSKDTELDWTGIDLSKKRAIRDPLEQARGTQQPAATSFLSLPGLPPRSALLILPHRDSGGPAFAIINADRLGNELPSQLTDEVVVSIDQSTQLPPRGVPFRGMTAGFADRLWSVTLLAASPRLFPSATLLPLGVLVSFVMAIIATMATTGAAQRRRLRTEMVESEKINQAREEFIASVSHEIRTPLTAVVGYAEMLSQAWDDLTDEEARDMVRQISEQSMEVSALVKDLLIGSRADISTLHLDISQVELREVAQRALASIPGDMRRPVTVGFDDDRTWLADPGRAAQIVRNLLVNAHKYGGAQISIESRRLPHSIVLSVVDDGEGVPPEFVDLIFQPFSSLGKGHRALPSVGLGLHVSNSLAKAMGGSLRYRREQGLTSFDLELPSAVVDELPLRVAIH